MGQMAKWADEFRQGWRGIAPPLLLMGAGVAALCLALATAARWGRSLIRPEIAFSLCFPGVLFASALGGFRVGGPPAIAGGVLGAVLAFGEPAPEPARLVLLLIYAAVCGLIIWGTQHFRSIASH